MSRRPRRALLLGPVVPRAWAAGKAVRFLRELRGAGADPRADLRIGIDRGALVWARLGLEPDLAVGDWDSLGHSPARDRRLSGVPHLTLDRRKDRSDLFYGLGLATLLGARELLAVGVTGGRADHHLASLQDLGAFAAGRERLLERVSAIDATAEYHFVTPAMGQWRLNGARAAGLVSVFAWNGVAKEVTLRGFEYELRGARLDPSSQGLSNRWRTAKATVRVGSGMVLVVVPRTLA